MVSREGWFLNWECWCTSIIPALVRLRQQDLEFQASLGYIARPCRKRTTKNPCFFKKVFTVYLFLRGRSNNMFDRQEYLIKEKTK
jgi:hypothetical protein